MGFTSFDGEEECAISVPVLILCEPVSSCLTDFKTWMDASSTSIGSSFTTTEIGVGAECRSASFALWVHAVCLFPRWTHRVTELSCRVSLVGDVLGLFWKKWLKTELLHFWSLTLGVLHLTAEAGVFGEIGGESKVALDNCCLEKEESQSACEWKCVKHMI